MSAEGFNVVYPLNFFFVLCPVIDIHKCLYFQTQDSVLCTGREGIFEPWLTNSSRPEVPLGLLSLCRQWDSNKTLDVNPLFAGCVTLQLKQIQAFVCVHAYIFCLNSSRAAALLMFSEDRRSGGADSKAEAFSYALAARVPWTRAGHNFLCCPVILGLASRSRNCWGGHRGFPQLVSSGPTRASDTRILSQTAFQSKLICEYQLSCSSCFCFMLLHFKQLGILPLIWQELDQPLEFSAPATKISLL